MISQLRYADVFIKIQASIPPEHPTKVVVR